MTVLILHGIMGKAGENWMQWFHDELVKRGHKVLMPELPDSDHPNREDWLKTIQSVLQNVDDKIVFVGHSLGVTSALDYCSVTSRKIHALVSVSGFFEPYGMELNNYFLQARTINVNKVRQNIEHSYVIYGDNDPYVPQVELKKVAGLLKVKPVIVKNGGHLNSAAGYTQLPQVLKFIETL